MLLIGAGPTHAFMQVNTHSRYPDADCLEFYWAILDSLVAISSFPLRQLGSLNWFKPIGSIDRLGGNIKATRLLDMGLATHRDPRSLFLGEPITSDAMSNTTYICTYLRKSVCWGDIHSLPRIPVRDYFRAVPNAGNLQRAETISDQDPILFHFSDASSLTISYRWYGYGAIIIHLGDLGRPSRHEPPNS